METFWVVLHKTPSDDFKALDKNGNYVLLIEDAKLYWDQDKANKAIEKFKASIDERYRADAFFKLGLLNVDFNWEVKDRFV